MESGDGGGGWSKSEASKGGLRAGEERAGPEMYGAGPIFRGWRMRRGPKQKVDRATTAATAALRRESSMW